MNVKRPRLDRRLAVTLYSEVRRLRKSSTFVTDVAKVLPYIKAIADYSRVNEPDVLRYAVCLQADGKGMTNIYIIEEYTNEKARQTHLKTEVAETFLNLFNLDKEGQMNGRPSLVIPPATVHVMHWTDSKIEKSGLASVSKPLLIWATVNAPHMEALENITPHGAAVVEYAHHHEPGCHFHGNCVPIQESKDGRGFIAAVEVYENHEAFGAHAQADVLKTLVEKVKVHDSKLDFVALSMVGGFLTREAETA
ncbi:hypothetical protein LTR66_015920 [Elasticomyces elasticus]|nr:hypothetical protein LTR66_015920 [Elasticomyces elasticus]